MVARREHWISPEEYLAYDRTSIEAKFEYVDGQIYPVRGGLVNLEGEMVDLAGGNLAHASIAYNMANLLDRHLENSPCRFFQSDIRVQVTEKKYFYPDVTVSCNAEDWEGRDREDNISFPCLIVEVLSPGTEAYDRGRKFAYYRLCPSLQEYVLISTQYQMVEVFHRQQDGEKWTYQQFGPGQNVELASLNLTFPIALLYRHTQVPE